MSLDTHLPPAARKLKAAKADLWERAMAGGVGGFAWEYSHIMDRYFEERISEAGAQSFSYALVAVGGYGRGRLCPGSDVDVLVLFKRRIPGSVEEFIKTLLYPLWDLGLDLGHGVRTVSDCVSLAKKDYQVLASLMDARPLAGDAEVFDAFRTAFEAKVLKKEGDSFAVSLRKHNEARLDQYGDATGMLEPELKNGLGGLRDGQQAVWLSRLLEIMGRKPVFLPEELSNLRDDQAFLNRVRTALHLAAGRKNDRLFFDLQPPTARLMGFVPADGTPESQGRSVEFFLSRLYQAMTRIKIMRKALFHERFATSGSTRCLEPDSSNLGCGQEGLFFKNQYAVTGGNVLDAFFESSLSGKPLRWDAYRLIHRNAERLASDLTNQPNTLSALVSMFMAKHGEVACQEMVETGFLSALFPEFADVEHLIQFNDYHVHPVGRHTMATVGLLSGFLAGDNGWAGEIGSRLGHRDSIILVLAGFFHDLGKGSADHAQAGADIVRDVLDRFGRETTLVEEVAFLVKHHLLIPMVATRRDLSDESVAMEVASIAENVDRLDMLYLLSVADSMATGPRAWNSWTESLLAELYFKAKRLLEDGPLSEQDAVRRLAYARTQVAEVATGLGEDFVDAAINAMPPRAFLAMDAQTIVTHIGLVKKLWDAVAEERLHSEGRNSSILLDSEPGGAEGVYRLTIAAVDQAGLFATIAGALSLHGLDILAADIFSWKDATAVDVFTVTGVPESTSSEEVWERVRKTVKAGLSGEIDLSARLEKRRMSPLFKARTGPKLVPIVTVDNGISDYYTVIEVAAADRMGFLFDMARTIADHHLSIHLAKITTIKGRAADVFHVRTRDGQKLTNPEWIEALKKSLLEAASVA